MMHKMELYYGMQHFYVVLKRKLKKYDGLHATKRAYLETFVMNILLSFRYGSLDR